MIFNCKKSVYGALEIPDSLKSLRSEKLGIFSTHTHTHTHTRALSKSFSANKTTKRTSFFLCLCLSAVCSSLSAQVGIRTEDPRGMLHVDAKGDTRISTSDTVNISDDVVVTPEGRIGVGTLDPQARLDIVGSIRIQDGNEGGGKALTSDAEGRATWTNIAGSWYAALTGGKIEGPMTGTAAQLWPPFAYTGAELYPPDIGSANPDTGIITVPYTGTYRISITGRALNVFTNSPDFFLAYVWTYVNNSKPVNPHINSFKKFGWLDFGFMFFYTLKEGDELWIEPVKGNNNTSYYANQYLDTILQVEFVK